MAERSRSITRPFAAAIFDFDETMVDLEAQHLAACIRLCRELGDDYLQMPVEFRTVTGRRIADELAEMKRYFGWAMTVDELYPRRQELFLEECRRAPIPLMPGVERMVRTLHSAGLKLAVASSGITASIEYVLERAGIRGLFAAIVGGEDVTRGKPDAEPYLLAAQRLSVEPRACIVFEDSGIGVEAAKHAGAFCVAVRNPRAKRRQELDEADVVVGSFEEMDAEALLGLWRAE
jgi:HAD superfamily hydrolase (TIGR01509 family)